MSKIMETFREIIQAAADVFDPPPKSFVVTDEYGNELTYVQERTCQQIDTTEKYQPYVTHSTVCSLCGEMLALEEYHAPNYCPSCGAKVTDKVVKHD